MLNKSSLTLLLSVFILFSVACQSIYLIEQEELLKIDDNWIISVITHDDEHIHFAGSSIDWQENPVTGEGELMIIGEGARLISFDITGVLEDGTKVSVAIEDVQMVYILKTDGGKTIYGLGSLLLIGVVAVFLVAGLSMSIGGG